ncbi:DUF4238 domain-containing protein [Rhizobium leguminosarum]|uniref:DUF4238 domain-containing protein n=1 Tax=Rhizobium leguminosarum TaxID=384 RepID=UPI001C9151B7|nr:DUF4238 domain-containing protein [Rhizobium leguminosarum]MBY2932699.1 DUF4238 domain-containing protein [Rhizobium leguminosarum]
MARKRRNHFIPRMLLKRFASKLSADGDKHFIWRYEKGEAPREISTKDAAVAKDFYGEDDDELENSFVALEGAHSSALREIDAGSFAFESRSVFLADMVWLLAMRTQANRGMMHGSVQAAMRETARQLPSPRARRFMKRSMDQKWGEHFAQLPEHQRFFLGLPEAQEMLRVAKKQFFEETSKAFGNFVDGFLADPEIPGFMRDSHNKGLSELIGNGAKCPPAKSPASWSFIAGDNSQLVLGDSCVFARNSGGKIVSLIGGEDVAQLYFPISPNGVLVGHFGSPGEILSLAEISAASVAFSTKYLFADRYSESLAGLVERTIGTRAHMLQPGEEKALVSSLWTATKPKLEGPDGRSI